jgi:hypothetical protein
MLNMLLGGGIGMVGNLVGGWMQNRAAKRAADLQRVAATEAKDLVGTQLGEANAPIAAATSQAQQGVTTAANYAVDAAGAGAGKVLNTAERSNEILAPYSAAGGTAADYLKTAVAEGGSFNRPMTMDDFKFDPSRAFAQKEMEQALARRGAAGGGFFSGEALKDLQSRTYDLSSQEIAKAFDRGQTDTAARYARLFGVAGMGLDAGTTQADNLNTAARYAGDINMQGAGMNLQGQTTVGEFGTRGAAQIGGNIMDAARTQADIITGRGNAEGAAKIAGGNAWGGAIANGANTVGSAMIYKDIFKNPAVKKVN